jgi:hypothetical protein
MDSCKEVRRQVRDYRRACRQIGRLLDQGRLSEARQLNDEARTLYRRLYGPSMLCGGTGLVKVTDES